MALDIPIAAGEIGELYAELGRRLEQIVRKEVRAPAPLIEDACQFAWWRLVVHAHRVQRNAALSWLAKTAVHEALKLIRREERDLSLDALRQEGATQAYSGGVLDPDETAEQRAQLELLCLLPARQRIVLVLQAAGFSYEETAASLGISRRTVERQITRGRQELRATARVGVTSERGGEHVATRGSIGHGRHIAPGR
jgi:RNA polymerase sigma factor (sigma-70 family)